MAIIPWFTDLIGKKPNKTPSTNLPKAEKDDKVEKKATEDVDVTSKTAKSHKFFETSQKCITGSSVMYEETHSMQPLFKETEPIIPIGSQKFSDFPKTPVTIVQPRPHPPIVYKKEVITFIIENSSEVVRYKNDVLKIINNIIERKRDALFLFLQIGQDEQFYEPIDYVDIKETKILSKLLYPGANSCEDLSKYLDKKVEPLNTGLPSALFYAEEAFKKSLSPTFTFKTKLYSLSAFNIICVGSGMVYDDPIAKKNISSYLKELKELKAFKGIKYFCIKDSDAIKVAALGFPVIGHIISDFYA